MSDEIPAPPTLNEPTGAPIDEPSATRGANSPRNPRDNSDRDENGRDESGRDDDRPRDGVDPPEEGERDRSGPDRSERDRAKTDPSETDDECDPESVEYRIERLRLLRIVVTLAVVVARLIRSF
ncbi:hypothetical protein CK500_09175 [Halorubrum salipaludis]|uniref:Uncharacterized protein n=1 Tax=Halorubrum salipaludis TaxID=2032630 RepID=A0A2A2FFY4_9EURY|nr:hypothetical protein [Halorubrum salipaludis]PAU83674.1 hypothetical protein CK500_09175 [Halorubrum salipaludis]